MEKKHYFIVGDDHPLVQSALANALARTFDDAVIRVATNIDEVLDEISHTTAEMVDLVLLDLSMPGNVGFSGLLLLQSRFPNVPVAIISARDDPNTIRMAIKLGASGYIPKTLAMTSIATAVQSILDGELWMPQGVELSRNSEEEDLASRLSSLTAQQLRILSGMVEGKLNKQIGSELGIAEQTVKVHVSTILRKLKAVSRTQAAILIERSGTRATEVSKKTHE
jgi:DNA-binding NarL/FixJ family response regulator